MYVYKSPHEQSYLTAKQEAESLQQERAEHLDRVAWIDQRLQYLANYMQAITPLIEEDPGNSIVDAGLTSLCRDVLNRSGAWMTAQTVRNHLAQKGVDIAPPAYTNPMAVLHATLKRIGQVMKRQDGESYYAKIGLPLDAMVIESRSLPQRGVDSITPRKRSRAKFTDGLG